MSENLDIDNPLVLARYSVITKKIRIICEVAASLEPVLGWYLRFTKKLSIGTAHRTGIEGAPIEEIAQKLIDLQSTIHRLRDRSHQITQSIKKAGMN